MCLGEALNSLAKEKRMQLYGYVLKRGNNDVLRKALDFEVVGIRGCGRQKMTWRRQVIKYMDEIGLKKEDAIDRMKWCHAVNKLSRIMM